jgi:hypothetical protein
MSISLRETGSLETTNTMLAAALAAVGIPLRKTNSVRIVTGDFGDRTCFFFEEKSPCGLYDTFELIRAWDDPDWHEKHPEHPFAYILVAFRNREKLNAYINKGIPTVAVKKGSKIAFLPLNASDPLQQKVFAQLNRK